MIIWNNYKKQLANTRLLVCIYDTFQTFDLQGDKNRDK